MIIFLIALAVALIIFTVEVIIAFVVAKDEGFPCATLDDYLEAMSHAFTAFIATGALCLAIKVFVL